MTRWPVTATTITIGNTVNKENLTNKNVLSHKKKVCFYVYKISAYKKGKDLVTYTKNPRKKATPNSHGKFLLKISTTDSRGKSSQNIAKANFCGKFPLQILKFAMQKMVWSNPLCGRALPVGIKRKQVTKQKLIKAYKTIASERVKIRELIRKQTFQTFLKLVLVENDWHVLYLLYQLSNYHPYIQKMCPIWIMPNCYLKTKPKYEHHKKHFSG